MDAQSVERRALSKQTGALSFFLWCEYALGEAVAPVRVQYVEETPFEREEQEFLHSFLKTELLHLIHMMLDLKDLAEDHKYN